MRIAFASDDGKTIAAHFGQCAAFLVLEVEDGKLKDRQVRRPLDGEGGAADTHGQGECRCHGSSGSGHQGRLDVLSDCAAVVALGMGPRAAAALQSIGVEAVILSTPAGKRVRDVAAMNDNAIGVVPMGTARSPSREPTGARSQSAKPPARAGFFRTATWACGR